MANGSSATPTKHSATTNPTAVSPFGPMRKREKPPVGIPGQRKPSDSIRPRPAPPTSRFNPDAEQVATWRQLADAVASSSDYAGAA